MKVDLVGFLYWESNKDKVAIGGEVGSEWHLRVDQASPNGQQFIGQVLEVHPVPDIRNFNRHRVAINAVLNRVGVERKHFTVTIAGISILK